ncbi:MAG: 1,4-dihydroxy-2-naphthoate octaprenyltransferase [Bacteroidales bacterium]|nr:1,4-dihydroxy-2-naphthoate octaprenyltransferase [Bacteroidales bacterium]
MEKILLWLRIIRPHTLFAAVAPVAVGLLVAAQTLHLKCVEYEAHEALRKAQLHKAIVEKNPSLLEGIGAYYAPDGTVALAEDMTRIPRFDGWIAVATLLGAIALQVFANLVNDLYDYRRGADKAHRVGFARALAEGEVTEREMRRAVLITLALVVLLGIVLVAKGGALIFFIGVFGIFFAWLYTATHHSLSYLGVADVFVFLFFGVLATMGTAYLQTGTLDWQSVLAGGVNGVISMSVLCINNLRDVESDRAAGKRTIVVRFGITAGRVEIVACALFSLVFAWLAFGFSIPCLVALPMAYLAFKTLKAEGEGYNRLLVQTGQTNVLYAILVALQVIIF